MDSDGTRDDFALIGNYRGDAPGLFAATRGRDFDIEPGEWVAAAAPLSGGDDLLRAAAWADTWIYCSMWATSVGRAPARANLLGAESEEGTRRVHEAIFDLVERWEWPVVAEFDDTDEFHLLYSHALLDAFVQLRGHVTYIEVDGRYMTEEDPDIEPWRLALDLELVSRGLLRHVFVELSEYDGSARATIAPTQLSYDSFGREIPRSRRTKIVDEWCEFFASAASPIRYLTIASRAPKRLVSSLAAQTQLRGIRIKWGDYDDISPFGAMQNLWTADFDGATAVTNIEPLASAGALRILRLGDARRLRDYTPLARLRAIEQLTLVGGQVPSIGFVREMTTLRQLDLATKVLDGDFSPLLARTDLERLRVHEQRGMSPSYEQLVARIPALR